MSFFLLSKSFNWNLDLWVGGMLCWLNLSFHLALKDFKLSFEVFVSLISLSDLFLQFSNFFNTGLGCYCLIMPGRRQLALIWCLKAWFAGCLSQIFILIELLKFSWFVGHSLLWSVFLWNWVFEMIKHATVLLWFLLMALKESLWPCYVVLFSSPTFIIFENFLLETPFTR